VKRLATWVEDHGRKKRRQRRRIPDARESTTR
jgi:hypothetical protein